MEIDDDLLVVIIGDYKDGDSDTSQFQTAKIKEEYLEDTSDLDIEDLIHTAEKHGELVNIDIKSIVKQEPFESIVIKEEYEEEEVLNDEDYCPDLMGSSDEDDNMLVEVRRKNKKRSRGSQRLGPGLRRAMRDPSECISFVNELRKSSIKLRNNQERLIKTLAEHMRNIKPPDPPKDFYTMNDDSMLQCSMCRHISLTYLVAARHYQEYHGERYLVCFACGVDFRSKTNLYKHEKRCSAPDSMIVLKARALFIGAKGRNRPFICKNQPKKKEKRTQPLVNPNGKLVDTVFTCDMCPATFKSKTGLMSHVYVHQGVRPYQCKLCNNSYTARGALSRHYAKHRGIEYTCDHCQTKVHSRDSLIAHMNKHRPDKQFPCPECGKRYVQKVAMELHVNRVHRNLPLPFACQICPRRCPRMSILKTHMMEKHGMQIMTRTMFFKSLPTMPETQREEHAKIFLKSDVQFAATNVENEPRKKLESGGKQTTKRQRTTKKLLQESESTKPIQESEAKNLLEEAENIDLSEEMMHYLKNLQMNEMNKVKVICIEDGKIIEFNETDISLEDQEVYVMQGQDDDNELKQEKGVKTISKNQRTKMIEVEVETTNEPQAPQNMVEIKVEAMNEPTEKVTVESIETRLSTLFGENDVKEDESNEKAKCIVSEKKRVVTKTNSREVTVQSRKKGNSEGKAPENVIKSRLRRDNKGRSMPAI